MFYFFQFGRKSSVFRPYLFLCRITSVQRKERESPTVTGRKRSCGDSCVIEEYDSSNQLEWGWYSRCLGSIFSRGRYYGFRPFHEQREIPFCLEVYCAEEHQEEHQVQKKFECMHRSSKKTSALPGGMSFKEKGTGNTGPATSRRLTRGVSERIFVSAKPSESKTFLYKLLRIM